MGTYATASNTFAEILNGIAYLVRKLAEVLTLFV
jgi:hypothetical protein